MKTIFEWVKNIFAGRPRKVPERETQQIPSIFTGYGKYKYTQPRPNKVTLRQFSETPIPRKAINIVKNAILNLPIDIKCDKTNQKQVLQTQIIENIIKNPNQTDTYREFWGALIEDALVGDCGSAEIAVGGDYTHPVYLYGVDGFTMKMVTDWEGEVDKPRFAQAKGLNMGDNFYLDEQILYVKETNRFNTKFGLSKLEVCYLLIDYLINCQKYSGAMASETIPKFILDLGENIDPTLLDKFREYLRSIQGSPELPVIGGSKGAKGLQVAAVSEEMLFPGWQRMLISIIASVFGLDPRQFGMEKSNDRATSDEQYEQIVRDAIKPLALVIQDQINKKIVKKLGFEVEFTFVFEESLSQKQKKSERIRQEVKDDILTLDEARQLLGYDPINDEYGKLRYSVYKAKINQDYPPPMGGGYNGVGNTQGTE